MTTTFRITVETEQATLYFEAMPPMPVPRVGDDVFVPGDGYGWWRVTKVFWHLPAPGAMTPTMEARLRVEWSPTNDRPAPSYDEERGWVTSLPPEAP
jgi:hypothetical protein